MQVRQILHALLQRPPLHLLYRTPLHVVDLPQLHPQLVLLLLAKPLLVPTLYPQQTLYLPPLLPPLSTFSLVPVTVLQQYLVQFGQIYPPTFLLQSVS